MHRPIVPKISKAGLFNDMYGMSAGKTLYNEMHSRQLGLGPCFSTPQELGLIDIWNEKPTSNTPFIKRKRKLIKLIKE